jgi:hypothetical protein
MNELHGPENHFPVSKNLGNGTENPCNVRKNLCPATENQPPERGSAE